jgi:hypothetical protein
VVADRFEVPVVGAAFLLTMNWSPAGIHVEHDAVGAVETLGLPQRLPVQSHQPEQILFLGQQLGLEPVQGRGQRRAPVPDPLRADRGTIERLTAGLEQFTLADLLRQSVYSRLAGYEELNDAERLAADPTFRLES